MKSEGGEEAAVNPLALLCLTDSIVLFCFLAAEDSPPRCCGIEKSGGDEKHEPGPHTHRSKRESRTRRGNECWLWLCGGCVCVLRACGVVYNANCNLPLGI